MAYKDFANLTVLDESDLDLLMRQSVMRFASATERSAMLTAPAEGMTSWLDDVNILAVYDGTTWRQLYPPPAKAAFTNLTLDAGFTAGTAPAYSVNGTTVTLKGTVNITAPLVPSAGSTAFITSLPVAMRPGATRYSPAIATSGGLTGRLVISTTSMSITPSPFNTTNLSNFALDGIEYEL